MTTVRTWNWGSTWPEYYQVAIMNGPTVVCDDWTQAIDEMWESYVVYPQPEEIE